MAKTKGDPKSGDGTAGPSGAGPAAPAVVEGVAERKTAAGRKAQPVGAKAAARARKPARSVEEPEATEAGEDEGPLSTRAPVLRRDPDDDDDDDSERGDAVTAPNEPDEVVEVVGELVDDGDGDAIDADDPRIGVRSERVPASATESTALSRTDPLQAYLREVQRHPLLTPDEEKRLTTHYAQTQDVRTAARLVTANLRLVVKLAYEYRRAYKNIMDLIQEGNIGLMQAVKRYDPYRGVKLSSYAAWWIRAYILRFILNNWRLVKLGTTQAQRKLFFNLNKEKAKLAAMGMEPTSAEIALRLNVDEKEVTEMDRRLSSGEASLDAPVGDPDGRSVSRLDLMPSMTIGPDAAYEHREMGALVQERLGRFRETLKGKDVTIFEKRMVAEEPLTLQELGDEFGISRERVRQLEARLTAKLRVYLQAELGDSVGPG